MRDAETDSNDGHAPYDGGSCGYRCGSIAGGIYQTHRLLLLINVSKRADAVVIGIDVGAKGSKRAVLQFVTETGRRAVSRDLFQMLVIRFHKGRSRQCIVQPV